jgi:hypothetical protein
MTPVRTIVLGFSYIGVSNVLQGVALISSLLRLMLIGLVFYSASVQHDGFINHLKIVLGI